MTDTGKTTDPKKPKQTKHESVSQLGFLISYLTIGTYVRLKRNYLRRRGKKYYL